MLSYWWADKKVFDQYFCHSIVNLFTDTQEGKTENSKLDKSTRNVEVKGITFKDKDAFKLIKENLDPLIHNVNSQIFGFDLDGTCEFQISKYTEGQYYNSHIDLLQTTSMSARKLSITVQLSAETNYEGGDFTFTDNIPNLELREQGSVIVFPSFLGHKVTPIKSGERYSLVGWYNGKLWK